MKADWSDLVRNFLAGHFAPDRVDAAAIIMVLMTRAAADAQSWHMLDWSLRIETKQRPNNVLAQTLRVFLADVRPSEPAEPIMRRQRSTQ